MGFNQLNQAAHNNINQLKFIAMIINESTVKKIESLGYNIFGCDNSRVHTTFEDITYKEATRLIISDENLNIKDIKTPAKQEVTTDWILSKINKESVYNNLQKYLSKIFKSDVFIYVASYGIGVDNLFGGYKCGAKEVETKLNEIGLKYRTEFSDARWVYRFIISKDANNMKILESLN